MRPVALVLCTLSTLLFFVSAAPAAQAAGPRIDRGERGIVRAINHARARHGLPRLHAGGRLARAADGHTRSMLAGDYFGHGDFASRVRRYVSFRRLGETLAWSSRCGARQFVRMWLHSPPHRAVLLSPAFRFAGAGFVSGRFHGRRTTLWVMHFGRH
jgi:uncharacterized protein YkwD